MADLMTEFEWQLTSTGTAKAYNLKGYSQGVSFYAETSSGCTATIQIQTRAGSSASTGSTPTPFAVLSTINLSTGAVVVDQFMGPLAWVRPRVTDKNAGTILLRVLAN